MVLFRVELQKLLHSDVGKAKRIAGVLFFSCGIDPDSFHHEADVTYALEVRALVNGVNSLYVAGDLQGVQDFRLAVTKVQQ